MRPLLLCALLPLSAQAGVLWQGEFENSNLSEWDSYVLHANHWTFPTTPTARSGQHSARVELHVEDTYNSFQRAEVSYSAPLAGFEGSDLYYAWSARLTSADPFLPLDHEIVFFESTGGSVYHQVLGLHVNTSSTPPRVSWSTSPEDASWVERWHGSMSVDTWHDFVMHAKWSLDPTVGFIELWFDGVQVVPKVMMRTMVSANGTTSMTGGLQIAFHAGILLSPIQANKPVEAVYLDRFRVGTQWSDVVDAVVDAGQPDAGSVADAGAPDAGSPPVDAGVDAGVTPSDAGQPQADAGQPTTMTPMNGPASGCSCNESGASLLFAALVLIRKLWR